MYAIQILPMCNLIATFAVYVSVAEQYHSFISQRLAHRTDSGYEARADCLPHFHGNLRLFHLARQHVVVDVHVPHDPEWYVFYKKSYSCCLLLITHTAKVSLDRINEFLNNVRLRGCLCCHLTHHTLQTELINPAATTAPASASLLETSHSNRHDENERIGFNNAAFTWEGRRIDGQPKDTRKREFKLRIDSEVMFERGAVNLIVGPTGSGKTSLLFALLGRHASSLRHDCG
jgi:ABC-type multidrug transport system fused ATPase/permease subunit